MKILAFGEVLWDVYPSTKHIGGAVMNFAAHASRLGADVCFASAVGDDDAGKEALQAMADLGLNTDSIAVLSEFETGKCLVTLDDDGVPSYELLQNVAYDHIPVPEKHGDVLCFGTLSQRNIHNRETLRKLLKNSYCEIFTDINIRAPFFSDDSISLCLENATILKASDEDLKHISPLQSVRKAAEEIMQKHKNIKLLIVTLGEKGALVYDGEHFTYRDGIKTDVASTIGAGDSFSAAFLVKYLNGAAISDCLDAAIRLSSFVVSKQEAVPYYNGREFL